MRRTMYGVSTTTRSLRLLVAASIISIVPLTAQTRTPVQPRVTQAVDVQSVVPLRGNTHPLAQARFDTGAAPSSLPADRILLILKRSDQQEADLQQFLDSVQDQKSPNYRKFLTPEQFGQLYGVADSDLAAVTGWLQGAGFLVNKVNKARTAIEFSGNAGQVQNAFHTAIHSYLINGAQHYANASDPQIPAALAPVVSGIVGLNDFRPRPYAKLGPAGQYDPTTKQIKPQLTGSLTSGGNFLFVGPADAATIYNSPSSTLNANFASSGGPATLCGTSPTCDGTGTTIGIVGDSNINLADDVNYRSLFGLPANPVTVIVDGVDPGINGDSDEALLDTQISGGLAPGATIDLYVSADTALQSGLFLASFRAVDDNAADILNVSFGNCEFNLGNTNQTLLSLWEQAAAQGITVTVSTGDSGSAGCDGLSVETSATHGLAINGFASTPYNVAVGGTDFDILSTSFSTYVGTTNNAANHYGTVIGNNATGTVIPENPWNNSTDTSTAIKNNVAFKDSTGATNIVGAGGGASTCSTVTVDSMGNPVSCTGGYAKPSWQLALQNSEFGIITGYPAPDAARDVPDVSLFASNGFNFAAWAVCRDSDCVLNSTGSFSIQGFGGTSAAAPAFAGILALVLQKTGSRLGQADNVLYPLAMLHPSAFHDITVGDNSVPCATGSPNCGSITAGFLNGYDASAGYDLATGIGSVDVTALVAHWGDVHFTGTTTTLALTTGNPPVPIASSIMHGTVVTANATVTPAVTTTAIPTGDVAIVTNSSLVNNAGQGVLCPSPTPCIADGKNHLNATGTATGNINYLPGGTYQITGRYSGDANFASSTSTPPISLTVAAEPSIPNFNVYVGGTGPISANPSFQYGSVVSAIVQPVGTSAPANTLNGIATGTATFSDNGTQISPMLSLNSNGVAEYDTASLASSSTPPGMTHSLSASYSGDVSFQASNGGPVTFIISPATSTVTVTPSATSIAATDLLTLTTNVATGSHGAGPTGTVNFFYGGTNIIGGPVAVTPVAGSPVNGALASATASASFTASTLPSGADSITAVYNGDMNYSQSLPSAAVTVTVNGAFTLTAAAANPTPITAGAMTTSVITVTPAGGFTGALTFTCTVVGAAGSSDVHIPTCTVPPVTIPSGSTAPVTANATVSTTASVAADLRYPQERPGKGRWLAAGGGAVLACVFLFGIPARRRSWRAMLGVLVFLAAITFTGCGGGGSKNNGSGGGTFQPGTTADTYTATVTGTDSTGKVTGMVTFSFVVH